MADATPQTRYPINRWLTDLRYLLAEAARLPAQDRAKLLRQYYAEHYPTDPHSREDQIRLLACGDYLFRHLQEFAVEHWLEQDGDSCWVSPHLQGALYRLFAAVQIDRLGQDLPISVVLDLADEQQRLYPDASDDTDA
jgi:hypothetical protein